MAENKTKASKNSVEKFIQGVDNARRQADARELLKLYKKVTGQAAVMWGSSIIGFGNHHYVYDSGREGDVAAAGFSPRKTSLTLYIGDEFKGAKGLFAKLGKHKKSKACVYINKLDDVDLNVLETIIKRDFKRALATSK
ncbi:MAG: DUF1801 domain-containing protein [Gammaproteobacteria bacterium]|nr:DUF1801 domain-containing protein [Gammaproteobacteria bacterium]